MKKPQALLFALVSFSLLSLNSAALAGGQLYPKLYDATYAVKTPTGVSSMRSISDGKGHLRTEVNVGPSKMVTIMDYPGKTTYTLMEAQKMVIKNPIAQEYEGDLTPELAKKKNAEDLGFKEVLGHNCHGWKLKLPNGVSEHWVDEKAGILVHSRTQAGNYITENNLKSVNMNQPKADLFVVPAGYKPMNQ